MGNYFPRFRVIVLLPWAELQGKRQNEFQNYDWQATAVCADGTFPIGS